MNAVDRAVTSWNRLTLAADRYVKNASDFSDKELADAAWRWVCDQALALHEKAAEMIPARSADAKVEEGLKKSEPLMKDAIKLGKSIAGDGTEKL